MSFIELNNITYTYPLGKEPALRDVSFSFEKGKFYGIIGENGGGKTTLCNLIRGLIPHFYRGKLLGRMTIDGEHIQDIDIDVLSTRIGYIFQNPFTQISGVRKTVFEEIALGLENLGVSKERMIEKVLEVVRLLKIEELIQNDPNKLSGGQRQRVAFASIMAMDSEVFVIDEPTSQLDPQGTADIFGIIRSLKEQGKTVILVEHKVDLLAEYADEMLVLEGGKIITSGTTKEVLSRTELLKHGVMIPQAALLAHEMQKQGMGLSDTPVTRGECVRLVRERMGS